MKQPSERKTVKTKTVVIRFDELQENEMKTRETTGVLK